MKFLNNIPAYLKVLVILFLVNVFGASYFQRFDLTQDKRYTLSEPAKVILDQVNSPMIIDVFLEGDFPAEFRRLQSETKYLLEEFNAYNPNISFFFSNPVYKSADAEQIASQFANVEMTPARVNVRKNGQESVQLVFPWATANHNDKAAPVQLLKPVLGASSEERVTASLQNLEYAFINSFTKLIKEKSKKIAVLKGNGSLPDGKLADMLRSLQDSYYLAPFALDSITTNPEQALKALQNTFDMVLVAKPTKAFTDEQKLVLDQFILSGGKSLWLLDPVAIENDSLYKNGSAFALNRDLNLNDLFFKYGARVNPTLVKDLFAAPIRLAQGEGTQTQYFNAPWFYQPLVTAQNNHPITTNIERPIRFNYSGQIDTLASAPQIKKTALLQSSSRSKLEGVPKEISLNSINAQPNPDDYNAGSQMLSVLLEGTFDSAFKNRIKPIDFEEVRFRESGKSPTKIILVADGDLIANDLDQQQNPLELGFDKLTGQQYGNKEFLLNAVNYLLDDDGLINIRSKEIAIPFLNIPKTVEELPKWQSLSIGLPLGFLVLFGLLFYQFRKRRYAR